MAESSGYNKEPPENTILEARDKYVPQNPQIALAFEKQCVFVLVHEHDKLKERKGLYFVYDLGYKYGFVQKSKMMPLTPSSDWRADMCKVIENYEAKDSEQLSLNVGDIVNVVDRSPTSWYYGKCKKGKNEHAGWLSKHFIREQFDFTQNDILTYQFTVQAISSFVSNNTRDLEFSAKDRLDIIQRPNTSDTYWIARDKNGKIGRIPKAKVDEKPEENSVLLRFPWYHQGKSREQITSFMGKYLADPNHFLVRDSETNPGSFTICVTKGDGDPPLNILVRTSRAGYEVDDKPFESLSGIINYYSCHPIFIAGNSDTHYFLLKVIQREDWKDS